MSAHKMVRVGKGPRVWFDCSEESCWWCWLGTYDSERPGKRREHALAEWERSHDATVVEQARRALENAS